MLKLRPDFFVGTGDIVYYDNPMRVAETVPQLRKCWHEQFRFPRMIEFFRSVPAYWSKDDHDFRFNESDNSTDRLPLPKTGIDMFREQLPLMATGSDKPTYRTHRVSKDLQIWLTEGRDYRSPNEMADGPEKSLWGAEQREWLKTTMKASDAKWKILISPTPMVGPDDAQEDRQSRRSQRLPPRSGCLLRLAEGELRSIISRSSVETVTGSTTASIHRVSKSSLVVR